MEPQKFHKRLQCSVTDFFEAEPFESRYWHMVEFAREGVVPERVEPPVLDVEVELCLMELSVDFSVRKSLI